MIGKPVAYNRGLKIKNTLYKIKDYQRSVWLTLKSLRIHSLFSKNIRK